MDLEFSLENGVMSLKALSAIIDNNQAMANRLRLRLSWFFDKGDFYGRIYEREKVVFEKMYDKKYTHINIAYMHYDFKNFLEHTIFLRTPQPPKDYGKGKKGEGPGHWGNRLQERKLAEEQDPHPDTDYSDI